MNKAKSDPWTPSEIEHMLYLIHVNELEGWYCHTKEQHWKLSNGIKAKLLQARMPKAKSKKGKKI